MDWDTMNAARVKSLMVPALAASIAFAIASTLLVLPLAGMAIIFSPLTVLTVIVTVLLGLVLVRISITVAEPARLLASRE